MSLMQIDIRGPCATCLIWDAAVSYNQPEANLTMEWLKIFKTTANETIQKWIFKIR